MSGLIGRYRILRPLGEGGMGRLWLCEVEGDSGFLRRVVVKVVRDELDPAMEQLLLEEARLSAALSHRNIVAVLGLERAGDKRLMVLDYVDGLDLRRLLAQRGRLPWELAVFIAAEVAAGLDYTHRRVDGSGRPRRIVHRDVSCANILLSWEGEVKLTDFGIAQTSVPGALDGSGLYGNPRYLAPEQTAGAEVDVRADVFALGMVLREALTGEPARHGDGAELLRQARTVPVPRLPDGDGPPELADLIERATAMRREDRLPTAAAMREALLHLPGLPLDPSSLLAQFLAAARRPIEPAALLEAVLGGGHPVTRLASAPTPSGSRRLSAWIAVPVLLVLVTTIAALLLGPRVRAPTVISHPIDAGAPIDAAARAAPRDAAIAPAVDAFAAPVCLLDLRSHPSGARFTVDNASSGTTPAQLRLACRDAPHSITVSRRGFDHWQSAVVLQPPGATVNATLVPLGLLSVNAIPWANLFIDGRAMGHTPRLDLSLPVGRHELKLVTSSGEQRRQFVLVEAGKSTKVAVVFREP